MDNNFKEFVVIDEASKIFLINRPILVFLGNREIDELLKYYESKYRDYKLVYCERGEPLTEASILHLYRIHEFFLENKMNTKKFHILYENRSVEYENLLGFFQFNFYYYPYHLNSQTPFSFFNVEDYPYQLDRDFEKVFLSLNRTNKEHRSEFKTFFDSNNLRDKSYYSFLWQDEKNFEENYHQPTHAQHDKLMHLYENSAINLLTETKYSSETLSIPFTFISEKTFRALAFPRPFIVIGQRNILKNLQKMGFRTFSDIIDESYDDLPDSERMNKIQEIILDLSKKSKEEIYEMWEKCKDNYEHNRKSILYHTKHMDESFKTTFGNQYKLINAQYLASIERSKVLKNW